MHVHSTSHIIKRHGNRIGLEYYCQRVGAMNFCNFQGTKIKTRLTREAQLR